MFPKILIAALVAVSQAGSAPQSGWKPYTPTKGAYSVSFPAKPVENKRTVSLAGSSVDLWMVYLKRGVTAYTAASGEFSKLPDGDPAKVLDAARDELAKQLKGQVADEKPIDLSGHPGRE